MIKYTFGTDLWQFPDLAQSMFRDRAIQYSKSLSWDLCVDGKGYERDQYDILNPIYVIVDDEDGRHAGSIRLLPTTGRTMINERFVEAIEIGTIACPFIWECTRFCLSPTASTHTAAKTFAGAGRLMQELNITSLVAVFDRLMLRKYRMLGIAPKVLGEGQIAGTTFLTGRWQFSQVQLNDLMRKASLDPLECELALVNSSFEQERKRVSA